MSTYATKAIQSALSGQLVFCKFLSANDTGLTGGHQAGIYISKPAIPLLFDEPCKKGTNKERWVQIHWQDDFYTDTRFIYYGQGTRNEYRITNFGRDFPFLEHSYTGALLVLVKQEESQYDGFVLNLEDEINQFLDTFGISPAETNKLIDIHSASLEAREQAEMDKFISSLKVDFPLSEEMSAEARSIYTAIHRPGRLAIDNPDKILVEWTDTEYRLFRYIENSRYFPTISRGFPDIDTFVALANQVLNRRKSRAGKSLEHHLSAIFDENSIKYTPQAITEGNKRPDFIFPSQAAYHDMSFPDNKLISLAAKTTCKDRWRQVINEADRLRGKNKYLCTLQQGISIAQLDEMEAEKVVLVVPKVYIPTYPKERQDRIWPLGKFVDYIKEVERF